MGTEKQPSENIPHGILINYEPQEMWMGIDEYGQMSGGVVASCPTCGCTLIRLKDGEVGYACGH